MNVKIAAEKCRNLLNNADIDWEGEESSVESLHLLYMCDCISSGSVTNEKAHRWLGWIQGCLCCNGVAELEQLKLINKNS